MCACFPIVGPLFKILRTKVSSSNGSKSAGYDMGSAKKLPGSDASGSGRYSKRPYRSEGDDTDVEEEMKILPKENEMTR
jgi:hypothetical protein